MAEAQHGVVARRQLVALGLGRGAIADRLKRGLLYRLHQGVYVVGPRLLGDRGRWLGAVLACGLGAHLSHRSAGRFWGLLGSRSLTVEVTVAATRARRLGIRAHELELGEDEVEVVDGIPVTCVARTVFDIAGSVRERELERAWNEMEVRRLTSRVSVPQLLERYPRRPGAPALRRLLGAEGLVGIPRNEFEEAFVALLEAYGLPQPEINVDLQLRGRFIEVDCLWRRERLALELDGRAVHAREAAFESDKLRDRQLLVEGWRTMRITWRQLQVEPVAVAADLREALAAPRRPE